MYISCFIVISEQFSDKSMSFLQSGNGQGPIRGSWILKWGLAKDTCGFVPSSHGKNFFASADLFYLSLKELILDFSNHLAVILLRSSKYVAT